jgi:hypothetical protein
MMNQPIQRVCKYPLLFAELLKTTPVCDCPDSHIEIENVLIRLREATTEINRVTDDPRMKTTMEKTWLLQDRLVFTEMVSADPPREPCRFANCCSLMQGPKAPSEASGISISAVCFMYLGRLER